MVRILRHATSFGLPCVDHDHEANQSNVMCRPTVSASLCNKVFTKEWVLS